MKLTELILFSLVDYLEYLIILSGLFGISLLKRIDLKLASAVGILVVISGFMSHLLGQDKAFIINSILILLLIYIVFRVAFIKCIYSYVLSTAILLVIQMLSFVLLEFIIGGMSLSNDSGVHVHIPTIIIVLTIRRFLPLKKLMSEKLLRNKAFGFILIDTFLVLMGCLVFLLTRSETFIVNALYIVVIVLMVVLINIILFTNGLRNEKDREQIKLYERYLPVIEDLMNDIRSKQHEYDNHIQSINSILNTEYDGSGDYDKIKKYVEDVRVDKSIANLGKMDNSILAGLIYTKKKTFEKSGIEFRVEIFDYLFKTRFKDYEMVEMIGILLDNALEASQKGNQVILKIYSEGVTKVVEVLNEHEYISAKTIDNMFMMGYTTKEESGHGYGLDNLNQLIKRNDGKYVVSNQSLYGSNFFSIKLMFD
ncbi:Histidine kinase-, DNA gyrase B-, and HSP90-like ATPase [Dethiosulfatibacter aminovorans DSM 17477]|uniref:Histidine kinase-, DNA gyrase B-, and HSP90-like ATPase n=1 Tax=Dethiosulfatibacter aminovorans DSM 17477 TaxID=1121476 RepID=A0A1M6IJF5_9FIRM|nr:GHKL domain-containing protein [Dethiosulfatibacter aminovorans]SHJ34556.1 Histidine kinase-, DNA gyrase B-, and HSP90-like ATPase [Dethiosulfatibacter aminovorans DSM 17477]